MTLETFTFEPHILGAFYIEYAPLQIGKPEVYKGNNFYPSPKYVHENKINTFTKEVVKRIINMR